MTETHSKIKTDIRKSDVGVIVELYDLDATILGGTLWHFTRNTNNGNSVVFNNITYLPLDFKFIEDEKSSETLPRPKIKISNVSMTVQSEIIAYNNLLGATVTRTRTLKKYLDGESEANPSITFLPDVYIFHKLIAHNKQFIEWELRSPLDNYRTLLPKKQILREVCQYRYRTYSTTTSGFVYDTQDPCPYTGTDYFDNTGSVSASADDRCGKRLSDCELRFVPSAGIPFQGFPSVSKTRI